MSNVETAEALTPDREIRDMKEPARIVRGNLRFLGSELRLVFRRRRNLLLLLVVALFPLLIGIGLKVAAPHGGAQGGNGPGQSTGAFYNQLAGNGVFLTFIALTLLLILVLPLAIAVVAGDSVAPATDTSARNAPSSPSFFLVL